MAALRGERDKCGRDDMVELKDINEQSIVRNLGMRLQKRLIFTNIGSVLVSVNPYTDVGVFGKNQVTKFKGRQAFEVPAHLYVLSEETFKGLLQSSRNQCVIISGESGAGKTEAAKAVMGYLAAVTATGGKIDEVKRVILQSNPLLESFGNAKTLRNDNSSRFGKYIEIYFDGRGDPMGGTIKQYLLEKSRVVMQIPGERNFHIFYQMFKGSGGEKKAWAIDSPSHFNYMASSAFKADGIDDARDFAETKQAMAAVGIAGDAQNDIFTILAAILHLGNIEFVKGGKGAEVKDKGALERAAYFFNVAPEALAKALTSRSIQSGSARGSYYDVQQGVDGAVQVRDALAKGVYHKLFEWIVRATNRSMVPPSMSLTSIGILDIFGFEIFENNSFEQLCINFTNEKLQGVFIDLTLKAEQEEYKAEGIPWQHVDYFDNKPTIDLIAGKPMGILSLLDEECLMPQGSDSTFLEKARSQLGRHQAFKPRGADGFTIKHYAGDVGYHVHNILSKNSDTFYDDLRDLMQVSGNQLLAHIFTEQAGGGGGGGGGPSPRGGGVGRAMGAMNSALGAGAARGGKGGKARPVTAGVRFKKSLDELIKKLYECQPHYIRCIKPNDEKRPCSFNEGRVAEQVRYLGLLENLRVRRAGFAFRCPFERWLKRYNLCSAETWPRWQGAPRDGVVHLMNKMGISQSEYAMGKTKVFVKDPQSLHNAESVRLKELDNVALKVRDAKIKKGSTPDGSGMQPNNIVLEYLQLLIFEELEEFTIEREPTVDKKTGQTYDNSKTYRNYGDVERDYALDIITPNELKGSLYKLLSDQSLTLHEHIEAPKQSKLRSFLRFFGIGKQSTAANRRR